MTFLKCHLMIERQAELNTIWENIPKYSTASVDVVAMPDLYKSFDRSGYETDNFQKMDHLLLTPFIIFDRSQLSKVLSTLEKNRRFSFKEKSYTSRMDTDVYEEMEVAISSSHRLTAEDFIANPYLLTLLIGEQDSHSYIYDFISIDERNKEIIKKYYSRFADNSMERTNKNTMSLAEELTKLSSRVNFYHFSPDDEQNNHLDLVFDQPYIKANGKTLYEATVISESTLRIRDLEAKLNDGKDYDQKARDGINKGLEIHKNNIARKKGIYFPMFKVL